MCVAMRSFNLLLPPSLPSFLSVLRSFIFSVFSLRLCVRAGCTRGCGCVLKASLHTLQGGSLLLHTQTMTCTFLSCLTWWPCACESVTRWNGIFYNTFFTECRAQGNTCFACDWLFSHVCCYCFISLAVNDTLYLPWVGVSRLYHLW